MNYKSFYEELNEGVEKYLIWVPTGKFRVIADELDKLSSSPTEVYRAASDKEVKLLKKMGWFVSYGKGNTRENAGTYVASDVHLAGAFAMRYYRDGLGGNLIILNREKLPELTERDPGNYTTSEIPLEAVKQIIDLKNFVSTDMHGIDNPR